jgi:hypothetical protein
MCGIISTRERAIVAQGAEVIEPPSGDIQIENLDASFHCESGKQDFCR